MGRTHGKGLVVHHDQIQQFEGEGFQPFSLAEDIGEGLEPGILVAVPGAEQIGIADDGSERGFQLMGKVCLLYTSGQLR